MSHILDNPIWNSLNSGCIHFSNGNNNVKYFEREVALFAGMNDYNNKNFLQLEQFSNTGDGFILFTAEPINIPSSWNIKLNKTMLQMVLSKPLGNAEYDGSIEPLTEQHVPIMLDLTQRTKPGPFLPKTILFGNYFGIFDGEKLIAMAGQRLKFNEYTEVSAVCTDPEYTGKGYAKKIMDFLLPKIIHEGSTPMLHLYKTNTAALNLYLKLGFQIRRELQVYFIQKN